MKVERALAWYCNLLLDRYQHLVVATAGRDGLPQLARVAYRRQDDDQFIALDADSALREDLKTVGPFAALLVGDDSLPLVNLSGAAELVADAETIAQLRGAFPDSSDDIAFYRLLADTLLPLQGAMDARTYADGAEIVRQGEIADRFYVIVQGECEVSRVAGSAPESLAQLSVGQFFGESGLLAGAPRNASVTARGEVVIVSLSRTAFGTAMHYGIPTATDLAARIVAATNE